MAAAGEHDLLAAALFAPTVGWTSRTLAELTGQSQSAVARAWRRAYVEGATELGARVPAAGLRLVAASAWPGNSVLVCTADGPPVPATGAWMRSPRRAPLQSVLAADLVAARRTGGERAASVAADAALVSAARERAGPRGRVVVISRFGCLPTDGGRSPSAAPVIEVVLPEPFAWQGVLGELVARCTRSPMADLISAQHRVMAWARSDAVRFEWTAPGRAAEPPARASGPALPPRPATQVVADEVLAVLLDRIRSGRLAAGERIPETLLARGVRATRTQVRDALRTLATAGLVQLDPVRGAGVPTPQIADVVEIYAARRALGALVVRRTALASGVPAAVEQALAELLDLGRTEDTRACGEADLRLQDALAAHCGMHRISQLMLGLTDQLRLVIAVMGLDYTYSVAGMCHDDTVLLERIRARDDAGATRVWHRKMDDALTYMTTQLAVSTARGSGPPAGRDRPHSRPGLLAQPGGLGPV